MCCTVQPVLPSAVQFQIVDRSQLFQILKSMVSNLQIHMPYTILWSQTFQIYKIMVSNLSIPQNHGLETLKSLNHYIETFKSYFISYTESRL